MMEIERKILEINKREVVARILKLKPRAKKVFEGLVRVKYFDFCDGRICRKRDLLRLREISPKGKKSYTELVYKTFKCVKKMCKYFDELEFTFVGEKSFENLSVLLKKIGLEQTLYYEKRRILYLWKNLNFEIDEHPKIPTFLEIEAPSPSAINAAVKILGLEKYEQTAENISELMKRKYPEVKLNGLKFR
ncbi:CYTH domain-containing protein [Candidatus Peregrinibacteria bacterium]|nr:CYTH domain-containing protein [Candidatus Peregrinibacteria bacterium]